VALDWYFQIRKINETIGIHPEIDEELKTKNISDIL